MPTYQYACTACDERLEAVQSFTDAPLTECPACGGRLRKVFSAVGVVFKGSGFYKTDSRGTASDGAKGETKADSKADSKADGTAGKTGSSEGASAAPSTGAGKDGASAASTPAPAAAASKSA